jgi:hypothetical protein
MVPPDPALISVEKSTELRPWLPNFERIACVQRWQRALPAGPNGNVVSVGTSKVSVAASNRIGDQPRVGVRC